MRTYSGAWALLECVPVPLGSAHQANALNMFTAALLGVQALHGPRPATPGPFCVASGVPLAAVSILSAGVAVTMNY